MAHVYKADDFDEIDDILKYSDMSFLLNVNTAANKNVYLEANKNQQMKPWT